jgi:hypothetical protein
MGVYTLLSTECSVNTSAFPHSSLGCCLIDICHSFANDASSQFVATYEFSVK